MMRDACAKETHATYSAVSGVEAETMAYGGSGEVVSLGARLPLPDWSVCATYV